jgi:hypothetical protein
MEEMEENPPVVWHDIAKGYQCAFCSLGQLDGEEELYAHYAVFHLVMRSSAGIRYPNVRNNLGWLDACRQRSHWLRVVKTEVASPLAPGKARLMSGIA